MSYSDRHVWQGTVQTLDGATDLDSTVGFVMTQPVVIHRVGLQVLNTAVGGASVVFEDRIDATTDVTIATVVIPASNQQGTLIYKEVASSGYQLEAGHRINLAVTEAGTAPTAIPVVEYSFAQKQAAQQGAEVVASS